MKCAFVEYMSYSLKKYGKSGIPYINILEEQVNITFNKDSSSESSQIKEIS